MIKKMRQRGGWLLWTVLLMLVLGFFLVDAGNYNTPRRALRSNIKISQQQYEDGVKILTDTPNQVVLDNGLVQVTFSNPGEDVGIKYNGIDNLLEINSEETNKGYWDAVWSNPGKKFGCDKPQVKSWPHNFTSSQHFPSSKRRLVSGHLQVIDQYVYQSEQPCSGKFGIHGIGRTWRNRIMAKGKQGLPILDSSGRKWSVVCHQTCSTWEL